ncbi:MAG: hypothetical protein JSV03_16135, partial [Planctomycetota bacterium]
YAGQTGGKICARGQMMADLMHNPNRIYRAGDRSGPTAPGDAIQSIVDHIRAGSGRRRLAVWLDGNIAIEDLAAARSLCEQIGDSSQSLIHIPPHELGAVEGLDAAGVPQAAPKDWQDADALLIIGNPFATHPPAAPFLMRWGKKRADTPMVVIDSVAGVTGSYTSDNIVCRPGYECWVLAAILKSAGLKGMTDWLPDEAGLRQLITDSGVDVESVNRAALKLRSAQRPAVVVAPQSGGADRWRALTATAASWARQKGGMVSVLTGSANALGISRYMRKHGIKDWASAGAGNQRRAVDMLLIVGWEPTSAYPRSMWGSAFATAQNVVMANAFIPGEWEEYDQTLPLALGSEAGGLYVLADVQCCAVDPLLTPPAGVPTVRELFAMLGECYGCSVQFTVGNDDVVAAPLKIQAPKASSTAVPEGWPAVMIADSMQYFDGQITQHTVWSRQLNLLPELWVSPADAATIGVSDGQTIRISNANGQAMVRVVAAKDQPEIGGCFSEVKPSAQTAGWLAVSGGYPEIRRLASWQLDPSDDALQAGTIYIQLDTSKVTDIQQEAVYARS